MADVIAESSVVHCNCLGAVTGEVEAFCERCLDAYADAVLQGLDLEHLKPELERIVRIVAERLQKDPDLADAVKANLQAEAALAEQRRPLS